MKGSKLGEPCPKVRLSQDRLPIEPFAYFAQMLFMQMLLRASVIQPILVILMWNVCLARWGNLYLNIVHCMTDQDPSLGSSFIAGNIIKSDEIP